MSGTMRMIVGDSTRILEVVPGNPVLKSIFPGRSCGNTHLQLLQNGRASLAGIGESIVLTADQIDSIKRALTDDLQQLATFYSWLLNPKQAMDDFDGQRVSGIAPRDADSLPEARPSYRRW